MTTKYRNVFIIAGLVVLGISGVVAYNLLISGKETIRFTGSNGLSIKATRSIENDVVKVEIGLSNAEDPGGGRFYSGWLWRKDDPAASLVYLGKFIARYNNPSVYTLSYSGGKELKALPVVFVSLESFDDKIPEVYLFQGEFKGYLKTKSPAR